MGKAVRLDRFLADSGAGTRTEVKKLIQKGMVQVNGEKAKKPELKIDPETDVVEFGGEHMEQGQSLCTIFCTSLPDM